MSALAACAISLTLVPAAQAHTATVPAAVTASYRAPGDVTLTDGDFGTVEVGETGTVTLTLTNNGTVLVGFDGLPLNLPPGVTRTGGTCDLDTAFDAGDSCTIELTWTPTTEGPFTGQVSLTVDEDGVVYDVTAQVTGNATTTTPPTTPPCPHTYY
ncbi:choice-of-anchor D domain-containing protein [Streptomyces sp. BE147]|nr:choice-of-anchor D domain-containing protein [Streptomyces sp. BE147]MEE1736916.1 choice-of-anchor D domain-containing protein [Streptomyces sp. BE147]